MSATSPTCQELLKASVQPVTEMGKTTVLPVKCDKKTIYTLYIRPDTIYVYTVASTVPYQKSSGYWNYLPLLFPRTLLVWPSFPPKIAKIHIRHIQ